MAHAHPDPSKAPAADAPIHTRHGVCNLCEAICGLTFQVQGSVDGRGPQARIISVKGNEADPLSRGHICPKAVALKDLHEDPDRLRQPVKRVVEQGPHGSITRWQTITWDEAFDLVVEGLARTREQHGSHAVGVYQGNPNVHNWGNVTHGHLFLSQLKTRSRFSATSADQLPHHIVAHWLYGHQLAIPIPDIDRTQYMLVLGGNPLASNGSLMTVPDVRARFKALKSRGGKLVVVDPRRTETAAIADEHLAIDPGTDAAWLLSLVHTLFAEELTRPGALEPLLDQVQAVRDAVAPFSPEATAALTGIDAATTRRIARELAAASSQGGAVAYGRMGVSTQAHGVVCQWAIQVINLLTGNIDREGGALLTSPALNLIQMKLMGPGHLGAWRSRVRGAPEFSGELPVSVLAEEMLTPGRGQIKALLTAAGNPVLSTPNGRQLDEALSKLDFMVSVDFYVNETTRHAHVILPPTCFVEHDHYDLVFLHLAVRNVARYSEPIVEPAPGTLHDWEIYAELAQRYARRVWALERGGVASRLAGLLTRGLMKRLPPHRLLAIGLNRAGASAQGLTLAKLRAHPEGIDLGPLKPSLVASLTARKKRIDLLPAGIRGELPQLVAAFTGPVAAMLSPSGQATLKLIGRRDVRSNNSWMHNSERLVSGKPRCTLWMHPDDAASRALQDGQTITVASRTGRIQVPVHVSADIRPGVVSLPHGWGHGREGVQMAVAQAHPGASINDLTDDRLTDRISANAAFSAVPVWIEAA
ncbi:MAG: molybdopterin-dependent oxidoreductase [Aquabacterium sp.]|uniref:molybdopterin-dependent oxidoreductase n=1 Tax=Aquabacterium sp. TaxID=1872578 RepID=UPI001D32A317|nr:molybdopterin-dependent oxidoreductase [Aquabacterium sp.]MBT9608624.1 molybdopterin-dependent oxidoreductase [Aquabacterium sp.]